MDSQLLQKPCLVQTTQGFSVSYNNKLLYSKYAPEKAIKTRIESLKIMPGTLFLCLSPVLEYGLQALEDKLPENCGIICAELDNELFSFNADYRKNNPKSYSNLHKTYFLSKNEVLNLPYILNKASYTFENGQVLPEAGTFRRVIGLEMSAGVQFHQEIYSELQNACTNSLMTFWSNRITLTKFGRLYSKNFFSNLKILSDTTPIETYIDNINKNIIVFGAGESFKDGLELIKNRRKDFFILCVDTALNPLLSNKIVPDGVFIEEAQYIISKAFIGTKKYNFQIFASLSSLPLLNHIYDKKRLSYFTTVFYDCNFINNEKLNKILSQKNNPYGSVGLTAVEYALRFRSNTSIPVYFCGFDFSYRPGTTHTNGTMAHNQRLSTNNKITPLLNYSASFNSTSIKVEGKQEESFYSTPAMINYANMFKTFLSSSENLIDIGKTGISLEAKIYNNETILSFKEEALSIKDFSPALKEDIKNYLAGEVSALTSLKDILTGKIELPKDLRDKKIKEIILPREYLYLHFPDGHKYSMELQFLKRVRTEIDYFLKILK